MIEIDGAQGEGGGQILRTAMAMSAIRGEPVRITRIRAGRRQPGLMKQHLAGVRAVAAVCGGTLSGDQLGSQDVQMVPGKPMPGRYHFAVGSAGAVTLVLQAVLPVLVCAGGASEVTLEGGTHVSFAPPWDFFACTLAPLLNRMGAGVQVALDRHGFYPAGGGRVRVAVQPAAQLAALECVDAGPVLSTRARVLVAHLPRSIAEKERNVLERELGKRMPESCIEEIKESFSPLSAVVLHVQRRACEMVLTSIGARGISAAQVAMGAVMQHRAYVASAAAADEHLADQLLIALALAGGRFSCTSVSEHTRTNVAVLERFGVVFKRLDLPGGVTRFESDGR